MYLTVNWFAGWLNGEILSSKRRSDEILFLQLLVKNIHQTAQQEAMIGKAPVLFVGIVWRGQEFV